MYILKNLTTDGTYSQGSQFERLMTESGHDSACFDLTEATSRFPVELEEVVLAEVLTPEIASLWRKTLTERTFEYKQHQVRYEVGQPMGFLSSWAVFALTHHLIIEYAAHELGLPPQFEEYSVLGDDVCIWNKLVANRYVDLLTELGVPIN